MSAARSGLPEVRNPILALPSAAALRDLPEPSRLALCAVLKDLEKDAAVRAQESWKRHKAPMAAYWKAVSVYAKHIRRAMISGWVTP